MTRRIVWTSEMRKRLALLRAGGATVKQIAGLMGKTEKSIAAMTCMHPDEFSSRHLFHDLPPDIVEWLIRITPAGASLADTVRSILVDAYNDETP